MSAPLCRLQPQPFTNEARTALWRLGAIVGCFPRWAHGAVGIVIKAGTIAIAVHATGERFKSLSVYVPVQLAASGYAIYLQQLFIGRRSYFSGVQLIMRIKDTFDLLKNRIQIRKEIRGVFGSNALAMLSPQHAAMFSGQCSNSVAYRPNQHFLLWIFHIYGRTNMEDTGIDMTKHAVSQFVFVQ